MVSRRWHSNEIGIDLRGGLQDGFHDVSPPNFHVHWHYGRRGALHGSRERPHVKKMDGEIAAGEQVHELAYGVDRRRRFGRVAATWP